MVKIEEVDKYRYLFAAILTVMVFMLGVLASNVLDDTRTDALEENRDENFMDLESQQLQLQYLQQGDQSCDTMEAGLRNIVVDYNERLSDLSTFEENTLLNRKEYEKIKRSYILSGIRYWMFSQDLKERCGYNSSTVLFFTTTLDKEDCQECQNMAYELDALKKRYGKKLLIFSIPTEVDDGMVDVLQEQYNVEEPPVLVINGDTVMQGVHTRAEIRENLNLSDGQ